MPPPTALRKSWRAARATFAIAAATILAWLLTFFVQGSESILLHASFIPERLDGLPGDDLIVPAWLTPLTALFVHVGFWHLLLNMLALFAFGRTVEPAVGTPGLVILYLAGAIAAAAAYYLVHPAIMPWVGAGGGVGAVLGAYALLFGRNRSMSRQEAGRGQFARSQSGPWGYALWLCAGWTALSVLVGYTIPGNLAVFYAPALVASFVIGLLLARPLLLLHYRKA